MKRIIFLICMIVTGNTWAQEWIVIDGDDFTPNGFLVQRGSFSISPYDNSIWWTCYYPTLGACVRRFDAQGEYHQDSYSTEPVFVDLFTTFNSVEFADNKTFVLSETVGLFTFNGVDWFLESATMDGRSLSNDLDTIWMGRDLNFFKWAAGNASTMPHGARRVVSKNGNIWTASSTSSVRDYNEVTGPNTHSPDTSNLLSWNNYDFKFSNLSDSLYVASERGFSIAYNKMFVDSLTPNNSINMPLDAVIEFEFDSQDNIWALFGEGQGTLPLINPTHIAFYERASNTWTQVYNESNWPFETDPRTIEVDSEGNLWVGDAKNIYVLKINNWPQWLVTYEHDSLLEFSVHPNPSDGKMKLRLPQNIQATSVLIHDPSGRLLLERPFADELSLDLPSGSYFMRVITEKGDLVERIIIE